MKKKIVYVSALLLTGEEDRVLLTRRPSGKQFEGTYEFPGGKIEPGETPEDALVREIHEELNVTLKKEDLTPFSFVSYEYENFHLVMLLFSASVFTGTVDPQENQEFVWADKKDMAAGKYPFVPADVALAKLITGSGA